MNRLSWMLYWADVAPKLSIFVAIIGASLTMASLAVLILHFLHREDTDAKYESGTDEYLKYYPGDARVTRNLSWSKVTFPLCLLLWASSFLVPGKTTFYMIAASEAGEQAVQTPEFARIRAVINNWLDDNEPTPDVDTVKELGL